MSPHLGQGANLALVDAWVLARCLDSAASLEMALAEYDRARRAQLRYYGAVTFALSPFFQSQGRVLGLGRDIGLPLISRCARYDGSRSRRWPGSSNSLPIWQTWIDPVSCVS